MLFTNIPIPNQMPSFNLQLAKQFRDNPTVLCVSAIGIR